jgi:precorrin-3B synthase
MSIVIDDGGALRLDALIADIRLVGTAGGWSMTLGDVETRVFGEDDVPAAVVAGLERIAALGPAARARDLVGRVRPPASAGAVAVRPVTTVGRHGLIGGGIAVGVGLEYGRIIAADLVALVDFAAAIGVDGVAPAIGGTLMFTGAFDADALIDHAAMLGLRVDPADPRGAIAACVGRPGCASGRIDTRAVAADLVARGLVERFGRIHVSGCAKGCAHPAAAPLTLVGTDTGGDTGAGADIAVVRDGTASSPAVAEVAVGDLARFLGRVGETDL